MSGWFLLASAIVQYQRKIKLLNQIKKIKLFNFSFFTKRFLTHKKHKKAPKAPRAQKSTGAQPNKSTKRK